MDQLIPAVSKLQDVFNAVGMEPFNLPQLVVVGSQSTGKSSVIEHIVGRDFLPRGSDIVTRRPLILHLTHLPEGAVDSESKEWAEFQHTNKIFHNFDEIRQEIENETSRVAGKNKSISSSPITLSIYSPNVINLTLVDLPGITKVPVGDQPSDIEKRIRDLVLKYISNPNSIILAVCASNVDLVNSESLKIANEVDPNCHRTIGILTKIDLMDQGTDAMNILTGKLYPLKLGYVPVINRSQKDINEHKSIAAALKSEKEFFANHPIYRSVASRCGTEYLSKTLNKILVAHIKKTLPELREKVAGLTIKTNAELEAFGSDHDAKNPQQELFHVIKKYTSNLNSLLLGNSQSIVSEKLTGGARINFIFNETYGSWLQNDDGVEFSTEEVRMATRNSRGIRGGMFTSDSQFSEGPFFLIVKKQIKKMLSPSIKCATLVNEEIDKMAINIRDDVPELHRYPELSEKILECVRKVLSDRLKTAKDMITNYVEIQASFINTNHPDFNPTAEANNVYKKFKILEESEKASDSKKSNSSGWFGGFWGSGSKSESSQPNPDEAPPMTQKEKIETEILLETVKAYTNIVKKTSHDMVPKIIMHLFVNFIMEHLEQQLIDQLYIHEEMASSLMQESKQIASERTRCKAMLEVLKRSSSILNEVGEL